jgi:hypothetical protein
VRCQEVDSYRITRSARAKCAIAAPTAGLSSDFSHGLGHNRPSRCEKTGRWARHAAPTALATGSTPEEPTPLSCRAVHEPRGQVALTLANLGRSTQTRCTEWHHTDQVKSVRSDGCRLSPQRKSKNASDHASLRLIPPGKSLATGVLLQASHHVMGWGLLGAATLERLQGCRSATAVSSLLSTTLGRVPN